MQVFKAFMKVLKKNLPTSMIYILIFMLILINMTNSSSDALSFKASEMSICIFDEDNTAESKALQNYIFKGNKKVNVENDRDKIINALYYDYADYIFVINKGYSQNLRDGNTDNLFRNYHMHDSYSSRLVSSKIEEYISTVNSYIAAGQDISEAVSSAEKVLSQETEVRMYSENQNTNTDFSENFSIFFQYLPYILISVMMNSLCPVLITMNKKDVRFRTNCSCVNQTKYLFQIFAGTGIFIIGIWLLFMIFGMILNKSFYHGYGLIAILNSFIFTLIAAAITILISSFRIEKNVINILTQALGLGMSFLCGIFVPMELLSNGVISAARFLPAYWYVKANTMLAGKEIFDGKKLALYLMIEVLFVIAITAVTFLIRKIKTTPQKSL